MSTTATPASQLKALQNKRATLKKIIRMALSLERLNESLQSVVNLGKPVSNTNPKIKHLIDQLDDQVTNQPIVKIKATLAYLEESIQNKLASILDIVDMNDDQLLSISDNENEIEKLLQTFTKNSQTAVALKGFLRSLGEAAQPTALSISSGTVVTKLAEVSVRESACRNKVVFNIMQIIDDTQELIDNPTVPEQLRNTMEGAISDLRGNIAHIKSGKHIENMSLTVEIINVSAADIKSMQSNTTIQSSKTTTATSEPQVLESPPVSNVIQKKNTFANKFSRWLNTPKGVSWDDIKKNRDLE